MTTIVSVYLLLEAIIHLPFLGTTDMCQLLECVGHSDDLLPMLVFCGQRILVFLWNLRVLSCRFKKFSFFF